MSIKKQMRQTNASGLRKPVYTQNNISEITPIKGKIRQDVEKSVAGSEDYDIYDLVADMANAMNDLLEGTTDSPAITKYKERQAEILALKEKYQA